MPINKDPEVFKLLVGIVGGFIVIVGGLIGWIANNIKSSIDKIFMRLNSTDHKLTEQVAKCEERHKKR